MRITVEDIVFFLVREKWVHDTMESWLDSSKYSNWCLVQEECLSHTPYRAALCLLLLSCLIRVHSSRRVSLSHLSTKYLLFYFSSGPLVADLLLGWPTLYIAWPAQAPLLSHNHSWDVCTRACPQMDDARFPSAVIAPIVLLSVALVWPALKDP